MELNEQVVSQTDLNMISADDVAVLAMGQYFDVLRKEKGNNPDASPLDVEILIIFKYMMVAVSNPIESLRKVGLIAFDDHICINCNYLCPYICSCRSRVNNSLKRIGWNVVSTPNPQKYAILEPLVTRADARNWTIRTIPPSSKLYSFLKANKAVQYLPAKNRIEGIIPNTILPNEQMEISSNIAQISQ